MLRYIVNFQILLSHQSKNYTSLSLSLSLDRSNILQTLQFRPSAWMSVDLVMAIFNME